MSISMDALNKANAWQRLGPISNGGTVFGLAVSPVAEVPRYWAATGCGVFHSDDAGQTWIQTLQGLTTPLLSTLCVAHNGALFAGALGGEIFSSFDFGKQWQAGLVPDEFKATVTAIVTSPNFAKDGTVFAATDGGGVLVSRGSGTRWEDSGFGLGEGSVLAIATAPDWSQRETMFAATVQGVMVSQNGGRAWRETELMLEDDVVDVLAVSPSFGRDRTVFAGTEGGKLYRSQDGGRTWDLMAAQLSEGPINCLWLAPDFAESRRMGIGISNRILVSSDGGESWQVAAVADGSILSLTGDSQVVLAGLHNAGILKSIDGGLTWSNSSMGLAARGFARLYPAGDKLYAIGPQEGLWVSVNEGVSWKQVPGADQYLPLTALAVTANGCLLIAAQEQGIVRSADDGNNWRVACSGAGIQALAMSPDGALGWAGAITGQLWATRDGGETWADQGMPCEGQEILSLAVSPNYAQDHTVLMGTSIPTTGIKPARVALWRSSNAGESWRQVTSQVTMARWIDICLPLGVTDGAAEQAILATGPFCLRPLRRAKDVWISTQVDPTGANTLGVVALGEVDRGGLLFAATGGGIHRSIDGGRTWQSFMDGLSGGSFISIVARRHSESSALFALSLGGTLWKCDLT